METLLAQRFHLVRELGAGGMGVVYEALDGERGERLALKTLRRAEATLLRRLKHEFRALANVTHPNLVRLGELFVEDDQAFFTMELVAGVPFLAWAAPGLAEQADEGSRARTVQVAPGGDRATRRLAGHGILPSPCDFTRLRPALRQLAEGVSALHAAGMLHRDLKSSNVLVQPDGRVVLLDFGLVTELRAGQEGGEGVFAGTPDYMAPEQAARQPFGEAADWYALGVLLFRALTGRLPFLGGEVDVLMDKQRFEPPPASQLAAGIPEDLDVLCRELLRREPRARPAGRDVLRRLGSAASSPTAPSSSSGIEGSASARGTFVGRERQIAVFEEALAAARRGETVVVELHGVSGMGKSALAHHLLSDLDRSDGALVLQGRCYERETVAYKALDSLVDALCAHLASLPGTECEALVPRDAVALARLFPVLRQVEVIAAAPGRGLDGIAAHELRRRAFRALRELLCRIGDRRRLVLALDDLQWGDVDSATLLGAVLRPPDPPPLLLLLGYRSDEYDRSEFLPRLAEELAGVEVRRHEIEVGPLDPEEAARLAAALLQPGGGDRSETVLRRADRIAAETGGNPLFIGQLVRHVLDDPHEGADLLSLERLLRERIERLPEEAGRLLRVLAIVGRPIPLPTALRAADVERDEAAALLRAGNLVRFHGPRRATSIECFHDRIREAQLGLLDPATTRALHLRLGRTLTSTEADPDPEELAVHFRAAGDLPQAAELCVRAAERAHRALAFARAARLYGLAVDTLVEAGSPVPRQLRVQLGDALANAGLGARAAATYLEAVPGADAAEGLDLQRRAATQLLYAGHVDDGMAVLRRLLDAIGLRLRERSTAAVASILWHRARLSLRGLDFQARDRSQISPEVLVRIDLTYSIATGLGMVNALSATEFLTRHLLHTLAAGEPERIFHALAAYVVLASAEGLGARARTARVVRRLEALAKALPGPAIEPMLLASTGFVAFNEGRWQDCLERCVAGEALFQERCAGYVWECTTAQIFQLFALVMQGRLRAVADAYGKFEQAAVERGNLYALTTMRTAARPHVLLRAGDPEGALADLADALARWPIGFDQLQGLNATANEAIVHLYRGDARRAHELLVSRWRTFERGFLLRVQTLRALVLGHRARAALAIAKEAGDRACLRSAEVDARRLLAERVDFAVGDAHLTLAGVARLRGHDELEASELRAAEASAERAGAVYLVAIARTWLGRLLGGTEGAELVARGETWGRQEGMADAATFMAALAPAMRR